MHYSTSITIYPSELCCNLYLQASVSEIFTYYYMPPFGCTHQSFIAGFEVSTVQMQGADTCGQRPLEIDSQGAVTLPAVGAKRP